MKILAIKVLEFIGNSLWGFRPNLMKDIVEIHGGWKSIIWFAKNMPKYERVLKKIGPERTHLLAVAISGINGCQYCTYGHALSFHLHYFKNKKQLFPIDEQKMMKFDTKNEQQIIDTLNNAFDSTGLVQEKEDLQRLIDLKDNPDLATSENDHRINHLIKMFEFLNTCGIKNQTLPDLAHDPINKNSKLYQQYQKAKSLKNLTIVEHKKPISNTM